MRCGEVTTYNNFSILGNFNEQEKIEDSRSGRKKEVNPDWPTIPADDFLHSNKNFFYFNFDHFMNNISNSHNLNEYYLYMYNNKQLL